MPNKNKVENYGMNHINGSYTRLSNVWKYDCPHKNMDYSGFSYGTNCLCSKNIMERSSYDKAQIAGKTWPVGNSSLGWKTYN